MRSLLLFLSLLSFAFADRDGGPYLGAGYSYAIYNDDGLYTQLKEDAAKSWMVYAGAVINKHLSVEFTYHNFGTFEIDTLRKEKIKAYYVSTLAHYPIFDDTLDLYGKFGVGELRMQSVSDGGFSYLYGVGLAYRFRDNLALRVAYERTHFSYEHLENKQSYDMSIESIYTAFEVQF